MTYFQRITKSRICFIVAIVVLLAVWFALAGCNAAPEIVRPSGPENPVVEKMRHEAKLGVPTPPNNSWLWWYAPVAGISVMWAVKYLFFRKCVEEEIGTVTVSEDASSTITPGSSDENKPSANT